MTPATAASAAPMTKVERDHPVDIDAEQRRHPHVLLAGALRAPERRRRDQRRERNHQKQGQQHDQQLQKAEANRKAAALEDRQAARDQGRHRLDPRALQDLHVVLQKDRRADRRDQRGRPERAAQPHNDAPVVSGTALGWRSKMAPSPPSTHWPMPRMWIIMSGDAVEVVGVPASLYLSGWRGATTPGCALVQAGTRRRGVSAPVARRDAGCFVSYRVSDGVATTNAQVDFTITGTNDAATVSSDIKSVTEGDTAAALNTSGAADDHRPGHGRGARGGADATCTAPTATSRSTPTGRGPTRATARTTS